MTSPKSALFRAAGVLAVAVIVKNALEEPQAPNIVIAQSGSTELRCTLDRTTGGMTEDNRTVVFKRSNSADNDPRIIISDSDNKTLQASYYSSLRGDYFKSAHEALSYCNGAIKVINDNNVSAGQSVTGPNDVKYTAYYSRSPNRLGM